MAESRLPLRPLGDSDLAQMMNVDPEFAARVRTVLAELVRAMEPDGGGADLVAASDSSLTLRLIGSCMFCPSRALSAHALARELHRRLPELADVHIVYPDDDRACR